MSDTTDLKSLQAKKTAALKLLARQNAEYQKLLDKGVPTRAAVYKRDNIDVTQKRIDEYDAKIAPIMSRMTTAELAAQKITRSGMPQPNIQASQSTPSTRARTDAEGRTGFATPAQTKPTSTTVASPIATTTTPTVTSTTTPTVTPTPATTGTGTATPTATGGKGTGKKGAADTSWEEVFKQKFPQYAYLLDVQVFGQDMSDLLRRAVTEKWYDSDQLETLMNQGFTGTNYYRTTTTNQQAFDKLTPANKQQLIGQQLIGLKDTFGNLQFTEQQLNEIATKAARDGKQGKALELFVYQQALATVPGATGFVAPTPASRVLTSSAADRVRNIGREYGVLPSNQDVQDVLTGVRSEDDLRQSYKIVARRWYKGVEEDLDSGLTIQQIFQPYRQYAAAVLEKSPNEIDFIDKNGVPTLYAEALQGAEGPLSLGQWITKLKSEEKYGYQFTTAAKQQATNLVMEMEKAFGFRK